MPHHKVTELNNYLTWLIHIMKSNNLKETTYLNNLKIIVIIIVYGT